MQLSAILESLLIASQDPLSSEEMARLVRARVAEAEDVLVRETDEGKKPEALPEWLTALTKTTPEEIDKAVAALNSEYVETPRAFTILGRPKGWKLYTRTEFAEFVRHLFPGRKPERLSGPAMETLAIVAYRQPITKAAIEAVRGVSCDGMIQKLLDRDLVRIGGRAELPGRPLLYFTTDLFFEHFGINSIDDLPNASELRRVKLPEAKEEATASSAEEQLALSATGAPAAAAPTEEEASQEDASEPESAPESEEPTGEEKPSTEKA
jgi:segregation and condensation protein B|tara:strand:+ start:396 stop:1196 length:801 start_codon:yes stop_codon:yes gene_type:complete